PDSPRTRMGTSRSISFSTVSRSARIARLRVRKKSRRRGSRRFLERTARPRGLLLLAGEIGGHVRRVAPKPLQSIEPPAILGKDVKDEIAVVEQDPTAWRSPFDEQRLHFRLRAQDFLNVVGNRDRLSFIRRRR